MLKVLTKCEGGFTNNVNSEKKNTKKYLPRLITSKNLVKVSKQLNLAYHVSHRTMLARLYEHNSKTFIEHNNVDNRYEWLLNLNKSHLVHYKLGYLLATLIEDGYPIQTFINYLNQIVERKPKKNMTIVKAIDTTIKNLKNKQYHPEPLVQIKPKPAPVQTVTIPEPIEDFIEVEEKPEPEEFEPFEKPVYALSKKPVDLEILKRISKNMKNKEMN